MFSKWEKSQDEWREMKRIRAVLHTPFLLYLMDRKLRKMLSRRCTYFTTGSLWPNDASHSSIRDCFRSMNIMHDTDCSRSVCWPFHCYLLSNIRALRHLQNGFKVGSHQAFSHRSHAHFSVRRRQCKLAKCRSRLHTYRFFIYDRLLFLNCHCCWIYGCNLT